MNSQIDRSDFDYNTVRWREDRVTIVPYTHSHVRVVRYRPNAVEPQWSVLIDVTDGHRDLRVAGGNRLAIVADCHLLAITCGEYWTGESLHNHKLHALSAEGELLWSRPWQTIQRFTQVGDYLLAVRYTAAPEFWIADAPLEAHLVDPITGDTVACEPIGIPLELLPHYQSGAVLDLKGYLIWHEGRLVITVRPYFRPDYEPAWRLNRRGSFKHTLALAP